MASGTLSTMHTNSFQPIYKCTQHSLRIRTCSYHNGHHFGVAIETSLYDLCTSKESVLLVFGRVIVGVVQGKGRLGHWYTLT